MERLKDNWELKKLFHFDSDFWHIYNDTAETVTIKTRSGQTNLKQGETVEITSDNYSIILPNNSTIRYSDKAVVKETDFWENFTLIQRHLVKRLKDGHIIDGLDFLDYHYKWTRNKKKFLTFVKHYILSVSWVEAEKKKNFEMYIHAITDWVEEKRKGRRKAFYIILLTIPIMIYATGLIWSDDYKEIFIGALIGGIAAPLKEIYDLLTD